MNEINQRVPKKMKYFSGLDDQINFATSTCQHPNQVNRPEQLRIFAGFQGFFAGMRCGLSPMLVIRSTRATGVLRVGLIGREKAKTLKAESGRREADDWKLPPKTTEHHGSISESSSSQA